MLDYSNISLLGHPKLIITSIYQALKPIQREELKCELKEQVFPLSSQICQDIAQYAQCSTNSACGCFHMINTDNSGVCGFLWPICSQLALCNSSDNTCQQSGTVCVRHSRCNDRPLCYPVSMMDQRICPSIAMANTTSTTTTTISTTTRQSIHMKSEWIQDGSTVAGGNERGDQLNQFAHPNAIYVDDDEQAIYIADNGNNRVVAWKYDATNGQIIIGGNGTENQTGQLDSLLDAVFDKSKDSFIICDSQNRQVLRWSRRNSTKGQSIISNISCFALAIDHNGDIYIYNDMKNEVRRWREGQANTTLVAGGNGIGNRLNQLECPSSMFVDQNLSIFISDGCNHRVVKWMEDAKEGIIVAGGQGRGNALSQLSYPKGVTVDHLGNVYVTDGSNHRIMRWLVGAKQGTIIVGGHGGGQRPDQLYYPSRLSFDRQHNLYVVDQGNNRVQKFDLNVD
ncbi:unnamed protein product [Adineta steineri]|uniref:NHL repeat containing protein n=1 Tax=Adineta steineri TaxID=433720 RepID=A0A814F8U2_9BILA|nr:unnamed protein product [Adineta steineri]